MTNLAGLPPLGQKTGKPANGTAAGRAHMGQVKQLPCLVCGAWAVEVHHEGKPRNDMRVLPLCPKHHRREFGPGAYHYSPKAFYALHGDSKMLLAKVADMLAGEFNEWGKS